MANMSSNPYHLILKTCLAFMMTKIKDQGMVERGEHPLSKRALSRIMAKGEGVHL